MWVRRQWRWQWRWQWEERHYEVAAAADVAAAAGTAGTAGTVGTVGAAGAVVPPAAAAEAELEKEKCWLIREEETFVGMEQLVEPSWELPPLP